MWASHSSCSSWQSWFSPRFFFQVSTRLWTFKDSQYVEFLSTALATHCIIPFNFKCLFWLGFLLYVLLLLLFWLWCSIVLQECNDNLRFKCWHEERKWDLVRGKIPLPPIIDTRYNIRWQQWRMKSVQSRFTKSTWKSNNTISEFVPPRIWIAVLRRPVFPTHHCLSPAWDVGSGNWERGSTSCKCCASTLVYSAWCVLCLAGEDAFGVPQCRSVETCPQGQEPPHRTGLQGFEGMHHLSNGRTTRSKPFVEQLDPPTT